jgi:CheY-like chemotaxis protein
MPGKKLLVADDSLTIQKVIRLALSNEGYEIQTVSDGNDAAQQVSLFRPDIVLIDVSLPGKSAFEVKREINSHEDLHEVRFVLMSSAFERVDEVQSQEVVFHGQLTKPFDPAHLRQVLSDVLQQVTAKRMEKTAFIQHQAPPSFSSPPPFPSFVESKQISPPPLPSSLPPPPIDLPSMELPSISLEQSDDGKTDLEVDNLWDSEGSSLPPGLPRDLPSDFPPDFPSAPDSFPNTPLPEFNADESDIKQLTESTLRGVGIMPPPPPTPSAPVPPSFNSNPDDFQWSVTEPSIKPHPSMLDEAASAFQLDEPSIQPPQFDPPTHEEDELEDTSTHESTEEHFSAPFQMNANLEAQIEKLVQSQVQATLEKLAQKIVPEVAERIIKQEIHRLLSE